MITKTSPFDFTQGNLEWESSPTSLLSTSPSLPPLSVAIAAVAIAVATVVARAVATVPLPLPPLQNIRRTRDVNRIWPATNLGNLRADCLSCGKPFYRCRRRCQIPRSSVSVSRNTCPALAVPLDGSTQARGMYITHVPHHFLRVALSQEGIMNKQASKISPYHCWTCYQVRADVIAFDVAVAAAAVRRHRRGRHCCSHRRRPCCRHCCCQRRRPFAVHRARRHAPTARCCSRPVCTPDCAGSLARKTIRRSWLYVFFVILNENVFEKIDPPPLSIGPRCCVLLYAWSP